MLLSPRTHFHAWGIGLTLLILILSALVFMWCFEFLCHSSWYFGNSLTGHILGGGGVGVIYRDSQPLAAAWCGGLFPQERQFGFDDN